MRTAGQSGDLVFSHPRCDRMTIWVDGEPYTLDRQQTETLVEFVMEQYPTEIGANWAIARLGVIAETAGSIECQIAACEALVRCIVMLGSHSPQEATE